LKTDYDNRYATIPALVKHAMKDKLFVALSENLARKDLTEDEKAISVYAFRNHTNDTIRKLADKLGISKTYADYLYQRGKQLADPTDANKAAAMSVIFINPVEAGNIVERTEKTVGLMKGITKLSTEEKVELMRTAKVLLDDLNKLVSFIKPIKRNCRLMLQ
jgi:ParB-like chromosome segregation protein Spo0J